MAPSATDDAGIPAVRSGPAGVSSDVPDIVLPQFREPADNRTKCRACSCDLIIYCIGTGSARDVAASDRGVWRKPVEYIVIEGGMRIREGLERHPVELHARRLAGADQRTDNAMRLAEAGAFRDEIVCDVRRHHAG